MKDARTLWGLVLLLLVWVTPSWAAVDETFRIIVPRAGGTNPGVGPNLPTDYWMLDAYSGVTYVAYAVVLGGVPPYNFSLSGQPSGMTIDNETGCSNTGTGTECFSAKITWPNPTSSSGTITLTATDSTAGTPQSIQSTWTVTVRTGTTRHIYADCDDAPSGNDGTIGNPYASLAEVYTAGATHANKILYLRACAGVYTTVGISGEQIDWDADARAPYWVAYPGETVTFDVGHTVGGADGSYVRFAGGNDAFAFVGIRCRNVKNKCVMKYPGMAYGIYAEVNAADQSGQDGSNPSFFGSDSGSADPESYFTMVIRNDFSDFGDHGQSIPAGDCVKLYREYYAVVGDNYCHDSVGSTDILGFDIKGWTLDNDRVINNLVKNVARHHCCGSMNGVQNMVVEHNRFIQSTVTNNAVILNEFGAVVTPVAFRRNTIVGEYQYEDVSGTSGPFNSTDNVHISTATLGGCKAATRIVCVSVSDTSRIVVSGDVIQMPSDNCVDANGFLVGTCAADYLGTRGAQVSASPVFTGIPAARRLRIR